MPKKSEPLDKIGTRMPAKRGALEIIGRMAMAAQGDNSVSLTRTARGFEVAVTPDCNHTIHLNPDGTWELEL